MAIELRDYQVTALNNIQSKRKNGISKGITVMASGLGKTYLSAFDVQAFERERRKPARVLYLAHQGIILEQALRSFSEILGENRSYGRFDGNGKVKEADLIFGTFQSIDRHAHTFENDRFDYIVVDEAHHSAATTYSSVLEYFQPQFLLGLTATPHRYDGKDVFRYYDDNILFNLPLEEALHKDLLTPVKYWIFTDYVEISELIKSLQQPDAYQMTNLFQPRSPKEIVALVEQYAQEHFSQTRNIVFCNSLKQMEIFAKVFPNSTSVSGRDDGQTQIERVDLFSSGKFSTLLARDVLNEGIDVPDANLLSFLRNTESPVVFLQQLGRGLRKVPGKPYILALDFVGNVERILFLYSLQSRLKTYQRQTQQESEASFADLMSEIEFDSTALEIIAALLEIKMKQGVIVPVEGVLSALQFRVSPYVRPVLPKRANRSEMGGKVS